MDVGHAILWLSVLLLELYFKKMFWWSMRFLRSEHIIFLHLLPASHLYGNFWFGMLIVRETQPPGVIVFHSLETTVSHSTCVQSIENLTWAIVSCYMRLVCAQLLVNHSQRTPFRKTYWEISDFSIFFCIYASCIVFWAQWYVDFEVTTSQDPKKPKMYCYF